MSNEDFYRLGTVIKTHGVRGNIVVFIDADNPERYKKLKAVFLQEDGLFRSIPVTTVSVNDNKLILHPEGVNDMDTAETYLRKDFYLPLSELPKLGSKRLYFHEAPGMQVHDKKEGEIGIIKEVLELPEQPVVVADMNGKELLFPLIPQFIIKVDRENKILYVDLPEGLTEVYR